MDIKAAEAIKVLMFDSIIAIIIWNKNRFI